MWQKHTSCYLPISQYVATSNPLLLFMFINVCAVSVTLLHTFLIPSTNVHSNEMRLVNTDTWIPISPSVSRLMKCFDLICDNWRLCLWSLSGDQYNKRLRYKEPCRRRHVRLLDLWFASSWSTRSWPIRLYVQQTIFVGSIFFLFDLN
jgi:hypothetical protein